MLPRALAHTIIVPSMRDASKVYADLMADECYRLELCGVSERAARWANCLNDLTCRSDLHLLTLLPLSGLVSSYQLVESANRFCPACYAKDERIGGPKYDRLLWILSCVVACPHHKCKLIPEPRLNGRSPLPFTVPGTSRIDGSSLAKAPRIRASNVEVEVARLVAELLEDVSRIGEQRKLSLSTFLTHAADVFFGGNSAAVARYLGLAKSHVHGWMNHGILPSLTGVARIALLFDCTMADVLLGNKPTLGLHQGHNLPFGLFRLDRKAGHKTSREDLAAQLSDFMQANPGANALEAANHLDVSPRFLRENFTHENEALVRGGKLSRDGIAQARLRVKCDAYERCHLALAADGIYPSRRKVVERLKEKGIRLSFLETKLAKDRAHEASAIEKRRNKPSES